MSSSSWLDSAGRNCPPTLGINPRNVSQVGAEDPEELIQDATAIAAKMLHSAEAAERRSHRATLPFTPFNTSGPAAAPLVHRWWT